MAQREEQRTLVKLPNIIPGRSGESMSNVDAAWLRMEDRTNLMTITGVMSFREPLDFPQLKELIEDRLLYYDRFRQCVAGIHSPIGHPRWVEDEHFTLRSHLQRVALPDPGGQHELQEMVSDLMSTPLDYSKPLWQMQYVENFRGGSAVIVRIHHCIADGIALIRVLLGMTDDSPTGSPAVRRRRRRRKPVGGGTWLPEVVNDAVRSVRKATGPVVEQAVQTLLDPAKLGGHVKEGGQAAGIVARLATASADPSTPFRGALGTSKRCAWSEVLPLDEVKQLGRQMDATINDVLLSGVTGALRRYLLHRQGTVDDNIDIRAVIPVNLRPEDEVDKLGNKFGLVFLSLPVGTADRWERLHLLKQRMDELKESSEAVVTYAILNALGMTSPEVESAAVQFFGSKATAVMTNVPGPREEIYLAGSPMSGMMFWVPQSARLGLGVSILSYAGQVRVGVATDAGLIPDPDAIIKAFQDEMKAALAGKKADD
jgi:WS/DGAT/MGAT family acyltransferase